MKKRFYLLTGFFVFALLAFVGCTYDDLLPGDVILNEDISLSNDIMPLFNQSCNFSGCHNTGGTAPDLTPANAFDALEAGNYINRAVPIESELYQWLVGNRALSMPLSGPDANINANVLTWIEQGATNN